MADFDILAGDSYHVVTKRRLHKALVPRPNGEGSPATRPAGRPSIIWSYITFMQQVDYRLCERDAVCVLQPLVLEKSCLAYISADRSLKSPMAI